MDKLKIGVLGLGRGLAHLRNLLKIPQAHVIGAADRTPANRPKAEALLEPVGGRVVEQFEQLLDMRPDAVVIASDGRLQTRHAIQALEAGCAVLSEIPGFFTLEEALELRAAIERTGRFYMYGENCCYWDFVRYWRKWVQQGRFGEISLAEGEYLHYLPRSLIAPDGSTWSPSEAAAAGRTDLRPAWRADQPPIQYLTHDLGPLLEVLDDRCVSVTCRSAAWRSTEAPLRPDAQIALFQTAQGRLIQINITLNTVRPAEHRYRLFGTQGSAEWFSYEGFCRRNIGDHKAGWERLNIGLAAPGVDATSGHGGGDLMLVSAFVDALLGGGRPPIDIYRGIEYALPGIIANRSAELGGAPLPIPDLRRTPFTASGFWQTLPLPDEDPPAEPYSKTRPQLLCGEKGVTTHL